MLKTKADTIDFLLKKKLKFKIPKTFSFHIKEWIEDKNEILKTIQKKLDKKVIVRSSALDEDGEVLSNAGKYLSIQNINVKDKKKLSQSINKVWKSYKSKNNFNKIIIQEQIIDVSMSGVLFTHELNSGSPYYVINYDDKSGKTDTVTSGLGDNSNKKIFILRSGLNHLRSKRFQKLMLATLDLEKKLNNNFLDIEFAVDKNLKPYLFQVRNISIKKNWDKISDLAIHNELEKTRKFLKKKLLKKKNIFGKTTIFAQMPDWNPAEMIGQNPDNLSYSLYDRLITNKSWSKARGIMGYNTPISKQLMYSLCGKPYIDTRLSFNSFLPKGLKKSISEKIINFWLEKLKDSPELHDKIEFKVAITCFSFDIDQRVKKLLPKISNLEKKIFIEKHKEHTTKLIKPGHPGSIENSLEKIKILIERQKIFKSQTKNKNFNFKYIDDIINDCIIYGVIPFAICARHAFISQTILESFKTKNIVSSYSIEKFKNNLNTVTSRFLRDINSVALKKMSKKIFMKNFGHLRPGTYDINSKRYDQYKSLFVFKKQKIKKINNYDFGAKQKIKIQKLINKNKIDINVNELIEYLKSSIVSREFSKFIFTKSVSEILSILSSHGSKNKLLTNKICQLKIGDFKKPINIQKKLIKKNFKKNLLCKNIKLPEVLFDNAGTYVIPYQVNNPNYITNKKIRSKIIFLKRNIEKLNLLGKIVLIEGADPGYDWIFSRNIKGLITKYGGANSHMAIRCAELNLPAAIGCGSKKFEILKRSNIVELDCVAQNIFVIDK